MTYDVETIRRLPQGERAKFIAEERSAGRMTVNVARGIEGLPPVEDIPERANREGDQALPVPGKQDVFEHVIGLLRARQAVGIKRYGRSLETFNGRDAGRDLVEELLDAVVYADQDRLERAELERQLAEARASVERLGRELAAARHNWTTQREELEAEHRATAQLVEERKRLRDSATVAAAMIGHLMQRAGLTQGFFLRDFTLKGAPLAKVEDLEVVAGVNVTLSDETLGEHAQRTTSGNGAA